jgi:protein-L-isoaspartate(D-aspartate) O-methyltransferase
MSYPNHPSMKELCEELRKKKEVTSDKVIDCLMKIDRADFAPRNHYQNRAQSIPCNVVISAPHLHGYCLQALENFLTEGSNVLDIGFGSGYLTVAMSKMMNDKGCVVGIEHMPELYKLGADNISKHHKNLLDEKKIILHRDDAIEYFKQKKRPLFKCIHVGAAAIKPPKEFLDHLEVGGRLVIPLGTKNYNTSDQFIYFIDKLPNGTFNYTQGLSVRYVDLTSVERQRMGYV